MKLFLHKSIEVRLNVLFSVLFLLFEYYVIFKQTDTIFIGYSLIIFNDKNSGHHEIESNSKIHLILSLRHLCTFKWFESVFFY